MKYERYKEDKPHYLKMVIWRIINLSLFKVMPRLLRHFMLRIFGARIGNDCVVYPTSRIYAPWNLILEDGVVIGPRAEIYNKAKVCVGKQAIISQDSYICTASHDVDSRSIALVTKEICIGNMTWIAARSIVLPGVTIEDGAVVGAGAVVTKNVLAWTVVGGNPARFIKNRNLANND